MLVTLASEMSSNEVLRKKAKYKIAIDPTKNTTADIDRNV